MDLELILDLLQASLILAMKLVLDSIMHHAKLRLQHKSGR